MRNDDAAFREFMKTLAETGAGGGPLPDPEVIRMKAAARARVQRWEAAMKPLRVAEATSAAILALSAVVAMLWFRGDIVHAFRAMDPVVLRVSIGLLVCPAVVSGVLLRMLWAEE